VAVTGPGLEKNGRISCQPEPDSGLPSSAGVGQVVLANCLHHFQRCRAVLRSTARKIRNESDYGSEHNSVLDEL